MARCFLLCFLTALLAGTVLAQEYALGPPKYFYTLDGARNLVLKDVNAKRSEQGLPALCFNAKLNEIALKQATYQASTGTISISDASGAGVGDRYTAMGFNFTSGAEIEHGEDLWNVKWIPDEYALSQDFKFLGVGIASSSVTTAFEYFWTFSFGNSNDETCN